MDAITDAKAFSGPQLLRETDDTQPGDVSLPDSSWALQRCIHCMQ
jgi:hypothetical protein